MDHSEKLEEMQREIARMAAEIAELKKKIERWSREGQARKPVPDPPDRSQGTT
jgi:hypothetical protein